MAVKKKEETEQSVGNGSIAVLGAILKKNKGEHLNFKDRVDWSISTGSLKLDASLGNIKPSLIRLCGYSNEGKSGAALEIVRQFLLEHEKGKAIWVLAEGRGLSDDHKTRCGLTFVYDYEKWVPGTIFILESNVYNNIIEIIDNLVNNNPDDEVFCFVIDSFDALILRENSDKNIADGNDKVAGAPALTKKFMAYISLKLFKYGHLVIGMSQITTEIKINQYEAAVKKMGGFSGGKGLEHFCDLILEFQRSNAGDFIIVGSGRVNDGKTKAIGRNVRALVRKTTVDTARDTMVSYPILFARQPSAIWVEREVGEMLIAYEIVVMKGAWLNIDQETQEDWKAHCDDEVPDKFNGKDKFFQFIEDNPKLCDYLFKKLRKIMADENKFDS